MTRQLLSRAWLRKERCSLLGRETHASLFPSRMFFCDTSFSVFLSFFLPPSFPTEARSRTLCWLLHRLLSVCLFDWWTDKHPTKEVRKRKKRKITLHTKQIVVYYFYLPVKKKRTWEEINAVHSWHLVMSRFLACPKKLCCRCKWQRRWQGIYRSCTSLQ